MKEAVTKVIETRGLLWGLPEVVGTVQVHCCSRRLLERGLEFHVCTINKSAHTKKNVWKPIVCTSYNIYEEKDNKKKQPQQKQSLKEDV